MPVQSKHEATPISIKGATVTPVVKNLYPAPKNNNAEITNDKIANLLILMFNKLSYAVLNLTF